MRVGASTANLYPQPIEDALDTLLALGFRTVEIFFNTESETRPAFARELRRRADEAGARIVAVHPYTSGYEPYMLFSHYERRTADAIDHYRRMYEAAALMGASFLTLHGDRPTSVMTPEQAAERTCVLAEAGRAYGVRLLQETVFNFRSSQPDYWRILRRYGGDNIGFTLDFKQCRRCNIPVETAIDLLGDGIAHLHISDADDTHDCLIPGHGRVDFADLGRRLHIVGFDGVWMLELYRRNFDSPDELREGAAYLSAVMSV